MTPKSEYLRNALYDRRARATNTPAPVETKDAPKEQSHPSVSDSPASDPWIEGVESDSDFSDTSPVRTKRTKPSNAGGPPTRRPTQRELASQQDKLKTANFDLSLKLQLLEEQNTKLKNELEAANARIDELEPLEDRMDDLIEDNNALRLKAQGMEEDYEALELKYEALELKYSALRHKYADMRAKKDECLAINQDIIEEMEKRDAALDEAADLIVQLEQENTTLRSTQPTGCSAACSSDKVCCFGNDGAGATGSEDSNNKPPSRILSVDESRPSTSYVDSDYYSQPASPKVVPETEREVQNKTPVPVTGPYSERARNVVDKTLESKNSIKELKTRISQVSLSEGNSSSVESPVPEVPRIPQAFIEAERMARRRGGGGYATDETEVPSLTDGTTTTSTTTTPTKAATSRTQAGLRRMFHTRPRSQSQSKSLASSTPPPPKLDFKSRFSSMMGKGKGITEDEILDCPSFITPPPRGSSRATQHSHSRSTHTASTDEHLQAPSSIYSESYTSASASERSVPHPTPSTSYPTSTSVKPGSSAPVTGFPTSSPYSQPSPSDISEMPSEPMDPRNKWWKDLSKLQPEQQQKPDFAMAAPPQSSSAYPTPHTPSSTTAAVIRPSSSAGEAKRERERGKEGKEGKLRKGHRPSAGERKNSLGLGLGGHLFNAAESEEEFLSRAKKMIYRRK